MKQGGSIANGCVCVLITSTSCLRNSISSSPYGNGCAFSNILTSSSSVISAFLSFNVKGVFAQDTAIYLDKYDICVRSGDHCDKKLYDEINIKNTVRISLYFYNTKEEIDKLVDALNNDKILEESLGV